MSDDNGRFDLTRRRLLAGLAATGAAAAGAGAGTWAYFQDTEESTGNTVQAGTLDLTTSNSGDFKWSVSNVKPGAGSRNNPIASYTVTLSHEGTVPADHVEIDIDNEGKEDGNGDLSDDDSGPESDTQDGAVGMAKWIEVEELTYEAPGETGTTYVDSGKPTSDGEERGIVDVNGNGWVDLDDLDQLSSMDDGQDIDGDGDSDPKLDDWKPPETDAQGGEDADFRLSLGVHPGMPNDYQGDVLVTKGTVSLHQHPSQDTDIDGTAG